MFKKITWLAVIILMLSSCSFSSQNDDQQYWDKIDQNYKVYAPPLPKKLSFAGEPVPLQYFDVRESLDRELLKVMYWHSETFLYLKRAPRFFPIVEKILKQNNIPQDFKYLMVAESGMSCVVSPSGAAGYWQFMDYTAKKYGLIVNNEIDQRYDIYKSTQAACNFFKDAYNQFGSWTLAAASFNVGKNALSRAIQKQGTSNFYNLALNTETARYLYRILAYKLIMSNPQKYGFHLRKQDYYYPIKVRFIKVDQPVDSWIIFAKKYGTNYKILLLLNPWIRSDKLSKTYGSVFYVRIPAPGARKYSF